MEQQQAIIQDEALNAQSNYEEKNTMEKMINPPPAKRPPPQEALIEGIADNAAVNS